MRALVLLLVLGLAVPLLPGASAAPVGYCFWGTFDDYYCVGQAEDCTGVSHRNDIADQYTCVGVYDVTILKLVLA